MSGDRKPEKYRGRLSPSEAAQGINAAARNARRLLEDAKLLLAASKYASSSALAILSIEESGKGGIIRTISVAPDEQTLRAAWKAYRSHQAKNASWIILDLVRGGAWKLTDFASMFEKGSDHPALLDALKQAALYTDYEQGAGWSDPDAAVDRGLAESIVWTAAVLCPKQDITSRDLEIWSKNLGAVWNTPMMPDGLSQYFKALHREGLLDHPLSEVDQFLGRTPASTSSKPFKRPAPQEDDGGE